MKSENFWLCDMWKACSRKDEGPRCAPHGAGVVIVCQNELHTGVLVIRLQVCAAGADLPVKIPGEAVLLHGARPKLQHGKTIRLS